VRDVTTLVRAPAFRASLYCTTCRHVVATGPEAPCAVLACYQLGSKLGARPLLRHFGKCAGGVLTLHVEELPPRPSPAPLLFAGPARRRRSGSERN
jgi:hypothetical protein